MEGRGSHIALPVFSSVASIPVGSGNFLQLTAPGTQSGVLSGSSPMLNGVRWMVTTGGTATGTLNIAAKGADGTYRVLSDVANITLGAALTYSGFAAGCAHGYCLVVTSLAVAPITYAELCSEVKSGG